MTRTGSQERMGGYVTFFVKGEPTKAAAADVDSVSAQNDIVNQGGNSGAVGDPGSPDQRTNAQKAVIALSSPEVQKVLNDARAMSRTQRKEVGGGIYQDPATGKYGAFFKVPAHWARYTSGTVPTVNEIKKFGTPIAKFHTHPEESTQYLDRGDWAATRSTSLPLLAVSGRSTTIYWTTGSNIYRDVVLSYPRDRIEPNTTNLIAPIRLMLEGNP